MNSKKVRDRTPEELLQRKKELFAICDILEEMKIDYYLHGGILLGAMREQNFIKWDWGVDIRVTLKDFFEKIDLFVEKLKNLGFEILNINKKKNDLKVYFKGKYPKEVSAYTVFVWNYSKMKDVYWRGQYSIPSKFFNNYSTITFLGRNFKTPYKLEEYLTFAYGDWKKPLRSSDKDLYNSKNYYKNSLLRYFKNKIKKLLLRN